MKGVTTLALVILIGRLGAQDCSSGRYVTANLFSDVEVTQAVPFGSNIGVSGSTQTLYMDVYEPSGDADQLRPVVVVAFGGSFIYGTRADVADLCMDFAKRGYVAVANDYRVGFFFPNQTTTTRAVMRGAHDMRACVRYLRKSVAELGNPYGIDTTRIIIGGVSAGAISALHATYLDQESEIPAVLQPESASLGGVEGNSGNPGYSSDVAACFSFSGALGDTSWIQPDDEPVVSLHEEGDNVVPYYTAPVYVTGIPTGLTASGSHDVHQRADHLGLVNCFRSYPGTGHVGYLSYDYAAAMDYVSLFLGELVCGTPVTCGTSTGITENDTESGLIGPNPTTGSITVRMARASVVTVRDASGRVLMQQRFMPGLQQIDLSALPSGAYFLSTDTGPMNATPVFRLD